jgi:hypothetical protein
LVLPVDDLFQARDDVRVAVLAQLDHDPAAAHFVGDGAGGAGTGEGVEDQVARLCCNFQHTLDETLWLWGNKNLATITN